MGRAKYLIAKYVPDLFRNEPINVGVVLWLDGQVGSKFISEKSDGKLDLRTAPTQIVSKPTFRQWVNTWRKMIEADAAKIIGTRETILKTDERFLDAIKSSGQGNYALEHGGQLLEEVKSSEFSNVLNYLFERLVEDRTDEIQNQNAKDIRNDLLRAGGLNADRRVIADKMVPCVIGSRTVHHEFHLYVGNGAPVALAQVIPLTDHARSVKKTAESFAYRFGTAKNFYRDENPECIAFVYNPERRGETLAIIDKEKPILDAMAELEAIATVIDITGDRSIAIKELQNQADKVKPDH
jgi:hypothetical protein